MISAAQTTKNVHCNKMYPACKKLIEEVNYVLIGLSPGWLTRKHAFLSKFLLFNLGEGKLYML